MDDELAPSEDKVYWFARDLVNDDKFDNYARRQPDTLRTLVSVLKESLEEDDDLEAIKETIKESIISPVNKVYHGSITKRYRQTEDLSERIIRRIEDREDVEKFILATESVLRITDEMDSTPKFGEDDVRDTIDDILESDDGKLEPSRAFDALYRVDIDGEAYQVGAQRPPLIKYVSELFDGLEEDPDKSEVDVSRIISGIAQEYERRAGNSRASTAGNVLETGLEHIFAQFSIPSTGVPEHLEEDIEVDNIVDGPDAKIGLSCKRTLRERYKQSLLRQAEIGVDEVWFVTLLMGNVSRSNIETIANDGGRIYVPRDSFVWNQYSDDEDLEYALRPADEFLFDVADFVGCSLSATAKMH